MSPTLFFIMNSGKVMKRLIIILATLVLLPDLKASNTIVKSDSLAFDASVASSPASLLKGRVSGLRVSATDGNINGLENTLIRGVNALRGDSQPLWIVDGVIVNHSLRDNTDAFFQYKEKSYTSPLNTMNFLSMYDIESIEIIKDLSAAAIYGSRGANGVILITTRKANKEGVTIDWRSNLDLSVPVSDNPYTKVSASHDHYVNISTMKRQTRFGLSAYFRQMQGIVRSNDAVRGGIRLNFDSKANRVVWFGMNFSVSVGEMSSIAGTPYFGESSMTLLMKDRNSFSGSEMSGWAKDYDDDSEDRRVANSMNLTLNFTPHLKLKTTAGFDFENNNRYIWFGDGTSFGHESNGAASILATSVFKYNGQSALIWDRTFASKHAIYAEIAVEATGDWTKYNTLNGTDFILHSLRAKGVQSASSKAEPYKYDHEYNTQGLFATFGYSFSKIVRVNALLRADRTPKYDDRELRLYKSFDLSLDLKQALLKDNGVISSLSLRGGYGEAGKETYVPYGLYGRYLTGNYPKVDSSLSMFYEGLNRCFSSEYSTGFDWGLFSNRLLLGLTYYDKRTNDGFLAYCFGKPDGYYWEYSDRLEAFSQSTQLANRGFETDIKADLIRGKDISWSVFASGSYNVNQLYEVGEYDCEGHIIGNGKYANINAKGYPAGSFYGYSVEENGSIKDVIKDGVINEFDKVIIGNPVPKFYGGFGTTVKYKSLTFDILADGAAGFDILNLNSLASKTLSELNITEQYVEKGDFLRLSRVSLAYSPKLHWKWLKGMAVSLSATNLFTITKYTGENPDVNCYGTSALSAGIDYGSYPCYRTIVADVNFKF